MVNPTISQNDIFELNSSIEQQQRIKREYNRRYYEQNKERLKENARRYHHRNKEQANKRSKEYHKKNRDELLRDMKQRYRTNKGRYLQAAKRHYEDNKEDKKEYQRQYANRNKEHIKKYTSQYAKKNKDYFNEANKRYIKSDRGKIINKIKSARRRTRQTSTTRIEDQATIAAYYKFISESQEIKCHWCKEFIKTSDRHVDHIIPVAKGGPHLAINLCCSCKTCNKSKRDQLPQDFSGQGFLNFS